MIALIKGTALLGYTGIHLLHSLIFGKSMGNALDRRRFSVRNTENHIGKVLKILNITCSCEGQIPEDNENYLLISNHLSYLDIPLILSQMPAVFITSVEIENTPFLGPLCRSGGCLFVERRNTSRIRSEIRAISDVLASGLNVVLFPEGTTSDGTAILPFKSVFFQAAKFAKVKILPLCVGYLAINGQPFSMNNKDLVCYHGNTTFSAHLFRLLETNSITAKVKMFSPLETENLTTRELSQLCHEQIYGYYDEFFAPEH